MPIKLVQVLANNANQDRTRDTIFYVENPCGKKPRAPTGDLHYMERVYRTQGIRWVVSSSRAAYKMYLNRTDWLQSNTETNPLINMTKPWALQASPQDQRYKSDHIPTEETTSSNLIILSTDHKTRVWAFHGVNSVDVGGRRAGRLAGQMTTTICISLFRCRDTACGLLGHSPIQAVFLAHYNKLVTTWQN